jgi:hypothetical protein
MDPSRHVVPELGGLFLSVEERPLMAVQRLMGTGAVITHVPAGLVADLQAPTQQVVIFSAQALRIDRDPPAVTGPREDNLGPAVRLFTITDFSREPPSAMHADLALLIGSREPRAVPANRAIRRSTGENTKSKNKS